MTLPNETSKINKPMLKGFLSDHSSDDKVVSILVLKYCINSILVVFL